MIAPRVRRPSAAIEIGGGHALRPWRRGDAAALVRSLDADPEIARWIAIIPQPYGAAEADAFIAATVRGWDEGVNAAFAIVDDRDTPVGAVDLHLDQDDAPSIGYWVARAARGRGLAARAADAVARFAFSVVGLDHVILYAQPDNVVSRTAAVRAGFCEAGTTVLGDGLPRIVYERRRDARP
jgi:RimJ/RimL family protein N-acetyltransferase